MLDPIQLRILGVLVEKEVTVPDSYPLTENTLQLGCNQKNNRDPAMSLDLAEIERALARLLEQGWVTRVEHVTGNRAVRWRHQFESQLGINRKEGAVLAELMLRGPQAPGSLKPRVARFGVQKTPAEILDLLHGLAARDPPLVEQQPRRPHERDQRWGHLLGPDAPVPADVSKTVEIPQRGSTHGPAPTLETTLETRLTALEDEVARLRREVDRLRGEG